MTNMVVSESEIPCPECGKEFKKKNLQCHISAVHRISVSNCDKCGKGFKNPDYLRNHVNKVHNIESVICEVCTKVCKSKANLYNHVRDVHESIENLNCDLCGELQKNYSYLSRHKRRFCKLKPQKSEETTNSKNKSTEKGNDNDSDVQNYIKNDFVPDENPTDENPPEDDNISEDEMEIVTNDDNLQIIDQTKPEENMYSLDPKLENSFGDAEESKFLDDDQAKNYEHLLKENEEQHDKSSEKGNENDSDVQNCIKDFVQDETPTQENPAEEDNISEDESEIVTNDDNLQTMDKTKPEEDTKFVVSKLEKNFGDATESKTDEFLDDEKYEHLLKENEEQLDDWEFCDLETENADFIIKSESMITRVDEFNKTLIKKENKIHKEDDSSITIKKEKIDVGDSNYVKIDIREKHKKAEITECGVCHKEFKTNQLKRHVKDVHTEEVCSCDECGKVFQKRKNLTDHKRVVHTEVKLLTCEFCSKQIRNFLLKSHIKNVHVKQTSACDKCGKIYPSIKRLRDHVSVVHSNMEMFCDLCGKTFKCKSYLANHTRRFHNAVEENISCDQCDKVFKTKNQHYLHNYAVHTVENIPCSICGKNSRNRYTMKKHMQHNHSS